MEDPQLISDPEVPALEFLLGPEATELLDAVVIEAGGRCTTARVTQVRYVPGRLVAAQFAAQVSWGGGPAVAETLVASSGLQVPETAPRVEAGDSIISIWRYPNDPFLPGLAAAADPDRVRGVLSQLGAPAESLRLRRRAYRPGRRAVIEAVSDRARIFLKVVRPGAVTDLQRKHVELADHVPVPHSYGWSAEKGLVAIQAMPGKTLRKAMEGGSGRLPAAGRLNALLDSLPEPEDSVSVVKGHIHRAGGHGRLLKAVMPELAGRIDKLIEKLVVGEQPVVAVHGDFHSSQVLIRGTDVVGLIDVDSAGRGSRADDLATMLAHVSTLSLSSPARKRVGRYGKQLIDYFDQTVDRSDLRTRVAAAVLGFATGPFRVQERNWPAATERRISLAEQWLDSAA